MLVVLTLIALGWMTLDLRSSTDAAAGPRRGALTVFAPVQQVLAAATRPFDQTARWIADQRQLHRRLDRLRGATARLRSADAANADLAAENARLRDLLDMRARTGHRTVGARVLGTPPGADGGSVLITAGTDRGLAPDMAVLDHRGLVGRVVAVTRRYAQVELVTSPTARYAVRVTSGGQPGRLRGGGDGTLRLEMDDPRHTVPVGASVVTRAFEGSTVPDGVAVGVVIADPVADRYLDVRPVVRTAGLDTVQVVADAAAPPTSLTGADEVAGDDLPPPPRPGER